MSGSPQIRSVTGRDRGSLGCPAVLLGAYGLLGDAGMRVLHVLRLLRLFKLSRYADFIHLFWEVLRENARNFAAAFGVLLIIMIRAASGSQFSSTSSISGSAPACIDPVMSATSSRSSACRVSLNGCGRPIWNPCA